MENEKIEQLQFELVFTNTRKLGEIIPLTRSDVIAEQCGIDHNSAKKLIVKYKEMFDKLGNEDKKGNKKPIDLKSRGRNGTKDYQTWYELNEEQVNFLITLFKNTEQVVELKFKLVKEFKAMKDIIQMQLLERRMSKEQRRILTDAIQEKYGNNGVNYADYTNLCYRLLFGRTAMEIKDEVLKQELSKCTTPEEVKRTHKDIDKIVRDYFTDKELHDIKRIESECATLIRLGMNREQVEQTLKRLYPTVTYVRV